MVDKKGHSPVSSQRNLQRMLELFVPKQLLQRVAQQGKGELSPGYIDEDKLTIFFSDIRSYTHLAEQLTAKESFDFLNSYFRIMAPPITNNHGFIDKYIGDAIMALFEGPKSANHAIQAAIEMHEEIKKYNEFRKKKHQTLINFGVGINTGPVIIGALGDPHRLDLTVIGDHVNSAARVEQLTKNYDARILISGYTYQEIRPNDYLIREIDTVKLQGKDNPITVYEVFDSDLPLMKEKKLMTRDGLYQGIVAYKTQQFEEALHIFQRCLQAFPQDMVVLEYIKRCYHFLKYPPKDEFWDGIVENTDYLKSHVQRSRSRHYLDTPVNLYSKSNDGHMAGKLMDVSQSGMRVEMNHPMQNGEVVMVEVFFQQQTLEQFIAQTPLKLLSKVAWRREEDCSHTKRGRAWQIGVEYVMLTETQEKSLNYELEQLNCE